MSMTYAPHSSAGQATGWRPILTEGPRDRALEVVQAIADRLRWAESTGQTFKPPAVTAALDASLSQGAAGLATGFAYLARGLAHSDLFQDAQQYLERALTLLQKAPMSFALYGGFTGIAWTLAHLQQAGVLDGEEDYGSIFEARLLGLVGTSPWLGSYDLIIGLVGIGTYALERLPAPSARELLLRVVERLDELAVRTDAGVTWFTLAEQLPPHQRRMYPNGYFNLGLAHGVPGVIAFLGRTFSVGMAQGRVHPLLAGAVSWLLHQRLPESSPAAFSTAAAPEMSPTASRSAWCYGDPGVAVALLSAARHVGEPAWEREALAIAHKAIARPPEATGVVDAGLCHGSAGLGHIYNRLYQATGDPLLHEAACAWFERTLAMRHPGRGIAGFQAYISGAGASPEWQPDPGLLSGAMGVALALLGATTDVEPKWDRMLLLDIPPATDKEERHDKPR